MSAIRSGVFVVAGTDGGAALMKVFIDPISTTSRPVAMLVAQIGGAIERELVSIRLGETKMAAFLSINPMGKVPVLVDGDFVLTEAAAILRYLATRYAPHLYPTEIVARARVDQAISWFSTDLYNALAIMTVYPRVLPGHGMSAATVDELAAIAAPRLRLILDVFDRHLGGHDHAAGAALSIADFLGLSYLAVGNLVAFDFSPWPHVTAWIARMQTVPGWSEAYSAFNGFVRMRAAQAAAPLV